MIYYLVSIPLSLSNTLLSDSCNGKIVSDNQLTHHTNYIKSSTCNTIRHNCSNGLIPLFCHTCPRIDCLKVMYKNIYDFKFNTNRVLYKPNDKLIKPFYTTNHRKNGFKI